MIYDYFRVSGAHDTVLDYADSFFGTFRNSIQDGTKFYYPRQRFSPDDVLESLFK